MGDVLGRGMGIVYAATATLARSRRGGESSTPGSLARDAFVAKRFRIEALAGARLTHKNVARVIDFGGGDDGAPYIVMEGLPSTIYDLGRIRDKWLKSSRFGGHDRVAGRRNFLVHADVFPAIGTFAINRGKESSCWVGQLRFL